MVDRTTGLIYIAALLLLSFVFQYQMKIVANEIFLGSVARGNRLDREGYDVVVSGGRCLAVARRRGGPEAS